MNEGEHPNGPQGNAARRPASLPQQVTPAATTLPLFIFIPALLFAHGFHPVVQITIPLPADTHMHTKFLQG